MTIRGFRGGATTLWAVVLVSLLATGTPAAWAASPTATAAPTTGLTIVSEPLGAAVYVDGECWGETPLVVSARVGEHFIRVVKDGYLENSRTVSVGGAGRSVQVSLTPSAGPPRAAVQVETGGTPRTSGRGRGRKLLLLGLGAVAAGATAFVALRDDRAPTVSGVSASPSAALQGATGVAFSAGVADPDGDSLRYTWSFGDGGTSTEASPVHVFGGAGTFDASVEVTDGKKNASGRTSVTVKGLAGHWSGIGVHARGSWSFTMDLAQSGTGVSGSYADYEGPASVSGSVTAPLGVRLKVRQGGYAPFTFVGTASADLGTITGNVNGFDVPVTFTLTRQ